MYYINPKGIEEGVYHVASQSWIPNDAQNKDWQDYLAWVAAGNTAEAFP